MYLDLPVVVDYVFEVVVVEQVARAQQVLHQALVQVVMDLLPQLLAHL